MRKIVTILFVLIYFLPNFAQQKNSEWRADWVITWEYIDASGNVEVNKARIRGILDNMKKANKNAVLWQVRQGGTAYYQSSYEPWGSYAGGTYPGFDPLAFAIEEAHKRGMELHAWFNCFAASSTANGAPAQKHPEWVCRDQSGSPMTSNIALSPGLDSVRIYTLKVAMELLRKYDIDGFHMDYVRWNEYSSTKLSKNYAKLQEGRPFDGQDPEPDQIKDLKDINGTRYLYDVDHPYSAGVPTGYTTWDEFWRNSVTKFVHQLHDSIQTVKPWVRLSGAVLGRYNWGDWNGYYDVFQDAALWFNSGWLDQLTPMSYHWTDGAGFYSMLVGGGTSSWGNWIQPGINAKRMFTTGPGSYLITNFANHEGIVNSCRTVPWNDGFQFFSYGTWRDNDYFTTAGTTFFKKNTKVRSIITTSAPTSPTITMNKIDSLHYNINVSPNAADGKNWYIIYRSPSDNFSKDTSEIVKMVYSDTAFVYNAVYNGLQDFNGKHRYSVTKANRYWNESNFSNLIQTDNIPSYAPKVASSVPRQNDTVNISSKLVFKFSKNIDSTVNFLNAIHITPAVTFSSAKLSADLKTLTYTPAGVLPYATLYTVTLDNTIKDVNGKSIDGNGDGIGGDPFTLIFRTIDHDVDGPYLLYSYPVDNQGSFDVEGVVSVTFNEYLDSTTVNANNVLLKRNGTVVTAGLMHSKVKGRSIINIKTPSTLALSTWYTLTLTKGLKDISGNPMLRDTTYQFRAKPFKYSTTTMIDDFNAVTGWEQPTFSGSTIGVKPNECSWSYSNVNYVPGYSPAKSAQLVYSWDNTATQRLIREYLSSGTPRNVVFDTTSVLQVYVWGDSSMNRFRFALDEGDGVTWPGHEVSKWFDINWLGWKLVEWPLSDTTYGGSWIGRGKLGAYKYRIDSFQLTNQDGSDSTGKIFFDNLRFVKKEYFTAVESKLKPVTKYMLYSNYPNPFNPSTNIKFDIPMQGLVKLEVYDILGRLIRTLINEELRAGEYTVQFDAKGLSSGQYIYRLSTPKFQESKIMVLMK